MNWTQITRAFHSQHSTICWSDGKCVRKEARLYIYIYMDIQLSAELSEGKFGKGAFFSLSSVSK